MKVIYGMLALGWRGSARHWHRYEHGLPAARGAVDAAGPLGAHGRELRLRRRHRPRLARDDLPALLRRRRDLRRLRDGADAGDPARGLYRLEDFITMRHLENMAKVTLVDRPDRRLRLRVGGVLRLVQRQRVRSGS